MHITVEHSTVACHEAARCSRYGVALDSSLKKVPSHKELTNNTNFHKLFQFRRANNITRRQLTNRNLNPFLQPGNVLILATSTYLQKTFDD